MTSQYKAITSFMAALYSLSIVNLYMLYYTSSLATKHTVQDSVTVALGLSDGENMQLQ